MPVRGLNTRERECVTVDTIVPTHRNSRGCVGIGSITRVSMMADVEGPSLTEASMPFWNIPTMGWKRLPLQERAYLMR